MLRETDCIRCGVDAHNPSELYCVPCRRKAASVAIVDAQFAIDDLFSLYEQMVRVGDTTGAQTLVADFAKAMDSVQARFFSALPQAVTA